MIEILTSTIGGSILGAIGGFANRMLGIYEKRQEHRNELELLRMRSELSIAEKKIDAEIKDEEFGHNLKIASIEHDKTLGVASQWVVNVLRLVRPTLTLLLLFITGMIWSMSTSEDLTTTLATFIVQMTTIAVGWWFGERGFKTK